MSGAAANRRRLGRGLEALLGVGTVEDAEREGLVRELPVDGIKPNRFQPRRALDPAALAELKASIGQRAEQRRHIRIQVQANKTDRRW